MIGFFAKKNPIIGEEMNITPLYNLKKSLERTLIAGTKLIDEDFRLKKAIQDFTELSAANPVFAKIKASCDSIFTSDNVNSAVLEALSLVDAVCYTQGSNQVPLDGYEELKPKERPFCNAPYSLRKDPDMEKFMSFLQDNPSFIETQTFWKNQKRLSIKDMARIFHGEVKIPYGVTEIGVSAFISCSDITSVIIPPTVTVIQQAAFCDCTNLKSIEIPDSVNKIGDIAFKNCNIQSLEHRCLKIEHGVAIKNKDARYGTSQDAVLHIPPEVKKIKNSAFSYHTSLTEVIIGDKVTEIEGFAFRDCVNLSLVVIPSSVKILGRGVFDGCDKLKRIVYKGTKEEWETNIKEHLEKGLLKRVRVIFESEEEPADFGHRIKSFFGGKKI